LRPTLAFVMVIGLLGVITQVDHIFILTKGGPSDSTNLLLFYVYQQAVEHYDLGKAAAATVITLALLLALVAASLRRMERNLEARE
jgi:sn-glycerol 3-phosphate transport system permease protein